MKHRSLLLVFVLLLSMILAGCTLPDEANVTVTVPGVPTDEAGTAAAPTVEATPTGEVTVSPEPAEATDEPDDEDERDADDQEDEADDQGDGEARAGCEGNTASIPPHAAALAEAYETTADEIMSWFCQGYGFGSIKKAYAISQVSEKPVADIFAMRKAGMGWGVIEKELGVRVKHGKGCNPHDEGCDKPGGGPPDKPGDGNGSKDKDDDD